MTSDKSAPDRHAAAGLSGEPSTIFRQIALERLSTPEQLDQAMRVTSPLAWLLITAAGTVLLVALIWSLVAIVPLKVQAKGILISPGGVLTVASEHGGRIAELSVLGRRRIEAGQTVARIEQPDLRQDLDAARRELAELEYQRRQIVAFHGRDMAVQMELLGQKKRDLHESMRHVRDRIRWLEERERNEAHLLERQIIDRQRYINTKIDLNATYEALSKNNNELKQIERDETSLAIGKERELLDKLMAISAAERKIEALDERLARQSVVVSPYAGDIVELKVNEGEVVEKGAALFSLLPGGVDAPAAGAAVRAVLFVPPAEGKKVKPGMAAQVSPSTVKREEYGFILGRVRSVAEIPSTTEGMMRSLKNQQLVQSLSGEGAPFEVIVDLDRDAATPTGYRWSSSRGPEGEINTGTLANGEISVREVHLISLALPALEQLLDR